MPKALAIVTGLVAVLFLMTGLFIFTLQPAGAQAGIEGRWKTIANGDDIRSLAMTGNVVWAGTHNGGVVSWDPYGGGSYTQYLAPQTGLVGNDVRAVASDGLYTVWFATSNGVSQYEPGTKQWVTYTTASGLPSNNATAVAYGPDGRLWVGTSQTWNGSEWHGGGLSICELSGDCVTYTVDDGLPSNNITDIDFVGSDVWVGTRRYKVYVEATDTTPAHWVDEGGGVARLANNEWTIFTRDNSDLTDNRINAVAHTPDGRIWFATPSGLVVYNPADDTWQRYRQADGLESNAVRDVTVDADSRIWALTYDTNSSIGALNVREGDTWTIYDDEDGLSSKILWSVITDDQGRTWVGTGPWCKATSGCRGGGLTEFRPIDDTWRVYRTSNSNLVSNQITDVAVADDGTLWITTQGSGVSMRDPAGQWHHFTVDDGLASNMARTVAIGGDGAVWIGTQQYVEEGAYVGGGISVYQNGEWTTYNKDNSGLLSNEIAVIEIDADGLVWAGMADPYYDNSGSGLAIYDAPGTETWTIYTADEGLPADLVRDIAFDQPHDRVWVATGPTSGIVGGGLAVFEGGNWITFTSANSDIPTWSSGDVTGDFRAVVVDADGNPWAGTYNTQGNLSQAWPYVDAIVDHLEDLETDEWTSSTFPQQGFISSLLLAPDGTLWAGIGQDGLGDLPTRGGLRARIDGTWYAATTATSGLAGNDITTLALAPNGGLWVGTRGAGLSLLQQAQPGPTPTNTPTNTPTPTHTPGVPTATHTPAAQPAASITPIPITPTPGTVSPPAEVPEAATLILVGTGLAGLGGYAARRWRSRNKK